MLNRDFPDALFIIVFWAIHAGAHRVFLHEIRVEWSETVEHAIWVCDARIQPQIVVFGCKDRRHAIVHIGDQ